MAHTDVHRPPLVQQCDPHNRHLFAEFHDHRDGACTLDRYRREGWFRGCCQIVYVGRRNIYCGCRMCTGHDDRKAQRHRERYGWRRQVERDER